MRMSASRIRSINRTLAISNGRPLYNDDRPIPSCVPDHSYYAVRFVPATRS